MPSSPQWKPRLKQSSKCHMASCFLHDRGDLKEYEAGREHRWHKRSSKMLALIRRLGSTAGEVTAMVLAGSYREREPRACRISFTNSSRNSAGGIRVCACTGPRRGPRILWPEFSLAAGCEWQLKKLTCRCSRCIPLISATAPWSFSSQA